MHRPVFSPMRLVGMVAVVSAAVLAAVAVSAAIASPARHAHATTTPKCATSGLVVWLNTEGNGTAGSIYYTLELTNLSGHTCTLHGYPGVSAVNLAGHQLGSPATRDTVPAPKVVKLANGSSAKVQLRIVEAGNLSASACHEVTAAGLRVYPPNQTKAKIVPFPFAACSKAGTSVLVVGAVRKA